ncbi:MAG TPA: STAS-like domain-containing protein [Candidatus Binataceae bacterium]|nr:STAS-like domain-containing protein [Candidatus Binataceae bacterium]
MTRIEVKTQLGNDVVSREHGEKMRIMLERAIANGSPPVIVDFAGMQITSVSFFDESFGVLAKEYGEDLLMAKVKLEGMDPFDLALVRDIVSSRSRETRKKLVKQTAR